MPYDPGYEDDDSKTSGENEDRSRRFSDFDCPDCSANNPYDDTFGHGDEIRCYYCGQEFRAEVNDSGKLRLRVV
jgi:transcription elongation factor Elf1